MKLKLSLLLITVNKNKQAWDEDFFNILVDENNKIPFEYVSTKTIPETIAKIYDKYTHLDPNWSEPQIEDLRRDPNCLEMEALYLVKVPVLEAWIKSGELFSPRKLNLEDFYGRAIIRQPRSL